MLEGVERNEVILNEIEGDNLKVEILQYEKLDGAQHVDSAEKIYFANQSGVKMRRIRMTVEESEVLLEPGLLHYMKGELEMSSSASGNEGGLRGFGKSLFRKVTTGESMFQSKIEGTGEIYLEPTFRHYFIYELDDEELIADSGIYVASDAGIEVTAEMQQNVSSALFGGEGLFQTKLSGTGIAVFASPVPLSELEEFELADEKMSVDGNFAILRSGDLEFAAERSTKSMVGFFSSGERILQTFTGSGKVWIAPTQDFYEEVEEERLAQLAQAKAVMEEGEED